MPNKFAAALIAATTIAFAAPAFAQDAPYSTDVVTTNGAEAAEASPDFAPAIKLGDDDDAEIGTFYQPTPFYLATPVTTQSEVAGAVITDEEMYQKDKDYAPILGDEKFMPATNLDGFNEDNSQFHVDDAKTTIRFGAKSE